MSNNPPTLKKYQSNPYSNYARKVSIVESGNNPNAKNPYSTAGGLYQFTKSSFENISNKYNLGYTAEDRFDAKKAEKVFDLFTQENERTIAPVLGRDINDADRYLAHFLGGGGASAFFKQYAANPNAPVSFSKAVINANKSVLTNKDGSLKTNQQLYNWAQNKMNLENTVTPEVSNFEVGERIPTFENSNVIQLSSAPEQQKVEQAKQELTQKQNEKNLQDYLTQNLIKPEPVQLIVQTPQTEALNILDQYAQISQLVENPILQEGGIIQDNMGQLKYPGKITQINSPNISMQGVNYPVLGIADTGEQKMMYPDLSYYFQGANNVLEIPLIRNEQYSR